MNKYVLENEGFITASKLKCFLRNPQEYYLQYVQKTELEEEEKRCYVIGTAFDTLVSYGEEAFLKKYFIDEGLVKDELYAKALAKGEIEESILKKWKLPELRAYVYEGWDDAKIRLTPAEGRDIMGMYREIKRQPIADFGSEYQTQYKVECEYKGLKLRGTLDRYSKEKKMIRDWKTSGRIDFFEYDMDEKFDYYMSMAFYYTLIKVSEGIECDAILDVVAKQSPYQFISYKLEKSALLEKMKSKVIPGLEAIKKAYDENMWDPIDPLTGENVLRVEMMKSPYYSLMDGSIQKSFVNPVY